MLRRAQPLIVMGVSGCGKSTVAAALASEDGLTFVDADALHPAANVAKMAAGIPLVDEDRWPWLDAIGAALKAAGENGIVVTCSALKRIYRDRIRAAAGRPVAFVFLDGPRALLGARIGGRKGHFMPPSPLDSQLATLERPEPDEGALTVSIEPPPKEIAATILRQLALSPASR